MSKSHLKSLQYNKPAEIFVRSQPDVVAVIMATEQRQRCNRAGIDPKSLHNKQKHILPIFYNTMKIHHQ